MATLEGADDQVILILGDEVMTPQFNVSCAEYAAVVQGTEWQNVAPVGLEKRSKLLARPGHGEIR